MQSQTSPIQTRAYIRGIPAMPVERQRELAEAAGCHHVYEWGAHGRSVDMRYYWINSLIPGDTAWLADIRALTLPKPPRKSGPMKDLGGAIAAVLATGAIIVDDRAGIRSDDKKRWQKHVEWALSTARAAERNQKRSKTFRKGKPTLRSIAIKWQSATMEKQRLQAARIWRDPKYKTAREAQAELPDELQRVSIRTLYTILDVRKPNDKRAGGRPRKAR